MASPDYNDKIQKIISKVFEKAAVVYPHCRAEISKLRSEITQRGANNFVAAMEMEGKENKGMSSKELPAGQYISFDPKVKIESQKLLFYAQDKLVEIVEKANREIGVNHSLEEIELRCDSFETGKDLMPEDREKFSEFKFRDGRTVLEVYESERSLDRAERLQAIELEKAELAKQRQKLHEKVEGKNLAERSKARLIEEARKEKNPLDKTDGMNLAERSKQRLLENARKELSPQEKAQEKMKSFQEESQKIMTKNKDREMGL